MESWKRRLGARGAALLFGAIGSGVTAQPAAAGGNGADLIMVIMDGICPSGANINGHAFPFSCYNYKNNTYAKGEKRGHTLMFGGDWKMKCSNGSERVFGNFNISMAIDENPRIWTATSVNNPCGPGRLNLIINHGVAPYGVGINFSYNIYLQE